MGMVENWYTNRVITSVGPLRSDPSCITLCNICVSSRHARLTRTVIPASLNGCHPGAEKGRWCGFPALTQMARRWTARRRTTPHFSQNHRPRPISAQKRSPGGGCRFTVKGYDLDTLLGRSRGWLFKKKYIFRRWSIIRC